MTELGRTFGTAAEEYDRVRPRYAPEVVDDLATLAHLKPGSRVLEIGCGTGQATVALAQRGYRITAVELGARLAEIARRNLADFPDVEVIVARFEEWPLAGHPLDAVVSATAFHWLTPGVRVQKAAEALRAGGSLAVIDARRRPVATEAVLARFRRCYEQWTSAPPPAFRQEEAEEPPECLAEVVASGLFDAVSVRRYKSTHEYSTREHHDLQLTFSNVLALDSRRRIGLVTCVDEVIENQLGGTLRESTVTELMVAHKQSRHALLS